MSLLARPAASIVGLVAAASLALAGCGAGGAGTPSANASTGSIGAPGSAYAYPDIRPAPPLDLTDQDGRAFRLASLLGAPVLVYFGYTHCPDVCPATVGILNEVIAGLGSPIHIVIVTVDPERDTVAALRDYLRYMTDEFLALTGTSSEIRAAADGYGVTYARVETGSAGGYSMAHTAEVYLIDQHGRLRAHYPFATKASLIVGDLRRLAGE